MVRTNLPLNPDPAWIAFRSLSSSCYLGFVQRLDAGGAGELHSLGLAPYNPYEDPPMRHALVCLLALCFMACSGICLAAPIKDPLLEGLVGKWVLRGTLAGKQTTHDVVTEWFLNHQYLRIHEISRELNNRGQPQYEAVVIIGWDETAMEYQCLWLDSTGGGGLTAQGIAHGKRSGDAIPFLFQERDGSISFNNTFLYDNTNHSWSWQLDNIQNGKAIPFGRVKLTRK